MQYDTILTITENTLLDCIERAGVGWMAASFKQAQKVMYVVVAHRGGIDNGAAKFVIKVKGVNRHPNENRVMFTFEEYAEIDVPNAWPGNRKPFTYVNSDDMGIDFEALVWQKVGSIPLRDENGTLIALFEKLEQLSIADIKKVIAKKYKVTTESIEINIKA